MKKLMLLMVACNIMTLCVFAQPKQTESERITNIADSVLYGRKGFKNNKEVIGAAIGIYWQGQTYFFTYGLADKEKNTSVSKETVFEIGSNTKVFTGLLLANELAKGTVTEKTLIDQFVLVNKKIQNKISLIDLADFTSGLPTLHDSESMAELEKIDSNYTLNLVTDDYLLSTLVKTEQLKNYGHYDYNNFAFGLLGYILRHMNQTSYEELLKKNILLPLEMTHTYAGRDTNINMLARGYDEGSRAPFINITGLAPAGIIKSNVEDMMQFVKYNIEGGSTIDNVLAVSQKGYHYEKSEWLTTALGWHISKRYGTDFYMMRGDTYGASSAMAFSKDKKFGIVILTNTMNSGMTQSLIFKFLVRIFEGNPDFINEYHNMPEVKLNAALLKSYTGNYYLEGMKMNVSLLNDKIYIQITGQEKSAVKAVSNNVFNSDDVIASFEFVKNDKGKIDKLILHQNGQDIPFIKK